MRIAAAGDAGDHRLEAAPGRRHQRQAVRQLGIGQDLLRGSPSSPSSSTTGQPHHSLIRRCAREATVVPPNDGMKAECLPGPPATVMWMSCGERPIVNQSPSGLWPVLV